MADMQAAMTKFSSGNPSPSLGAEGPTEDTPHRTFACFGCGSPEHPLKDCLRKTAEEKKQFWNQYGRPPMPRRTRSLNEKKAHACLWVKFKKRRISALLDTGSDITGWSRISEEDEVEGPLDGNAFGLNSQRREDPSRCSDKGRPHCWRPKRNVRNLRITRLGRDDNWT